MAAFAIQTQTWLQPHLQVGRPGGLAVSPGVAKVPAQEETCLTSNACLCLVAAFVGAAVVLRRFSPSLRARSHKAKVSWRHGSWRRTAVAMNITKRHLQWYDDTMRAPSWLPGRPDKEKNEEEKDEDEDEDEFEEGPPPKGTLPGYVNFTWWMNLPIKYRCRSPAYWKMICDDKGKLKYKYDKECTFAEAIDQIFAFYEASPIEDIDPALELAMFMGLDAKYPDQQIRMQVTLPNAIGGGKRVAVFCPPEEEAEALEMGAAIAGKTLQDELTSEEFNFDVLIAKPAMMPALAKLGKILGPRRLMPSPKSGTVVTDLKAGIEQWSAGGTVELRNNPNMFVGARFGSLSQGKEKCLENVHSLLDQMAKNAPAGAKKIEDYWIKMTMSGQSTPSVRISPKEFPSHGYMKTVERNDFVYQALGDEY